jgi:hypothetical protein
VGTEGAADAAVEAGGVDAERLRLRGERRGDAGQRHGQRGAAHPRAA